jgi:hypothetical protein
MGTGETALKKSIDRAADDLGKARDALDATARPAGACAAHDALFAVSKAQTNGILALLEVESSRLEDGNRRTEDGGRRTEGAAGWVERLTPWRWPVALACFSPFAGDVAAKVLAALK